MEELVPIFICAIMPISIVLIVTIAAINNDSKRAKVLMKAIESNNSIDADKLAEALSKPKKSAKDILYGRLLRGCIFSLVGLGLIIVSIIACANGASIPESDGATVPLIGGSASLAIGISYMVVYAVTRRDMKNSETNASEK